MTANPYSKPHDEIIVPEGRYFELYTPAAGRIKSPATTKYLQFVKFYLPADSTMTFKDYAGTQSTTVSLKAGYHPFLVQEITVCSGSVYIIHDGLVWTQDSTAKDMTSKFPV